MAGRPKSGQTNRAQFKAAQLRQSILQAAVQGKLVPQNLHDEPASELLKYIQQEKAKLIKIGKNKKGKSLSLITEEEMPYDQPNGWVWCRLGEVCDIYTGNSINSSEKSKKYTGLNSGRCYIGTKDVGFNHNIDYENGIKIPDDLESFREAPKGSVLLCIEGGSAGRKIGITNRTVCFGNKLCCFMPVCFENKYLYYYLQSPVLIDFFRQGMTGIIGGVSVNSLLQLPIALPPLAEQQHIVAKVDGLMALCDELEAAEKELDKLEANFAEYLPKSILQAAVQGKLVPQNIHDEPASVLLERIQAEKARLVKEGKIKKEKPLPPITEEEIPYDLPEGWEWCRLGELCNYGAANNASSSHISQDSWLLELEDIERDSGRLLQRVTFSSRASKSTKHVFTKGNILYNKLRPYLNKVIIAPEDGYCTSEILPLDFGIINHDYMLWFLRNPIFVEYTNTCSYGVKMPRLGTEDGRRALVPLPPLAEQQRIVAKVDELMALCGQLKATPDLPVVPPLALTPATIQQMPYEEPELIMAARGQINRQDSEELKQAQEDLFGE